MLRDQYSDMDIDELRHMARVNEAMAAALLQTACELVNEINLDFDLFIADATAKSDCDILSFWNEVRTHSEDEILERIENEFTSYEIENIKSLIAAGKL